MGGGTDTTTSTTGSASKAVNSTVDKLATGLGDLYKPGSSSYVAPGANTTGSWQSMLQSGNQPAFTGGLAGALQSYGGRASGASSGMNDPGYQTMRASLQNDVTKGVQTAFNDSGMFGSDQNIQTLGKGLGEALGSLDYQQYRNGLSDQAQATQMLPSIYQSLLMPSQVQGQVGAAQDADAAAKANGQIDQIGRLASVLNGTSGSAGQTTTNSTPNNLFMQLLGLGLGAL